MVANQHEVASTAAVAATGALRMSGADVERYNGSAWVKLTAYQAVKLATARTISLTGDASGSVAFDGSANVSIPTTIDPDSHKHERPLAVFGGNSVSAPNGGWSGLNVTNVWYDNTGIVSGQSARLTPSGWWLVTASVWFTDNPTGQRILEIWGLDPNIAWRSGGASDGAGRWARTSVGSQWSDGSKTAQAVVWQNSGAAITVNEWTMCAMWVA